MKMFFLKINFAFVITLTMNSSRNEEEHLQKRGTESSKERREQEVRVIVSPKKIFSVTEVTWRSKRQVKVIAVSMSFDIYVYV